MKPDSKHMISNNFPESDFFGAIQDEHKMALRETLLDVHYKESQNNNKTQYHCGSITVPCHHQVFFYKDHHD